MDVKPANMLRVGHQNRILISDLGLSSWLVPETQQQRIPLSTLNYQCPESRLDRIFQKPGDWWSFGCSLLQLATRKMPFAGQETSLDELLSLGVIPLPLAPEISPKFPAKLASLVDGLLQRQPEDRLTGEEVLGTFSAVLNEIAFPKSSLVDFQIDSLPPVPNIFDLAQLLKLSDSALQMLRMCVCEGHEALPLDEAGALISLLQNQTKRSSVFWGMLNTEQTRAVFAAASASRESNRFLVVIRNKSFEALLSPDGESSVYLELSDDGRQLLDDAVASNAALKELKPIRAFQNE